MLIGVVLLSACHTTRHTVSEVGVVQDQQSSHQEQTTTQRLDSLFSKLSVSADTHTRNRLPPKGWIACSQSYPSLRIV